jgi:hypothetical protein
MVNQTKVSRPIMEPESSLPCSHDPVARPRSDTDESSQHPHNLFL